MQQVAKILPFHGAVSDGNFREGCNLRQGVEFRSRWGSFPRFFHPPVRSKRCCEGKGLAIDVAVTCPFSASNMARDNPAEYYAEKLKHRKYDAGFVGINFDFSALVFESTGGLNREGRETLSQLFRFAVRFSGSQFSVFAGRA